MVLEQGVEDSRVGGDARTFDLDVRQGFCQSDRQAPDAAVADEHVRAATEDGHGNSMLAGFLCGFHQIFDATWLEQGVRGPAYLPGGVALQGFVELGRGEEPV